MRLVFVDSYFFAILAISLCTGMTLLQRLVSISWALFFIFSSIGFLNRGIPTGRLFQVALFSQTPAIILIMSAPLASRWHVDGWTDGILALWETPFEPLLELLPGFHVRRLSSMYLEDCVSPFVILAVILALGWMVRRACAR